MTFYLGVVWKFYMKAQQKYIFEFDSSVSANLYHTTLRHWNHVSFIFLTFC